MAEKKEKQSECASCSEGSGWGCCMRGHWAHQFMRIAIVLFVFWCGVEFGELKGMIKSQYGSMPRMYYSGVPMMAPSVNAVPTTAPVATTTKTIKK